MDGGLINPNPIIHERKSRAAPEISRGFEGDEFSREVIDSAEIFVRRKLAQHIRDIRDPEHPYSLEQLKVVSEEAIKCDDEKGAVKIEFTPTVQHCSMATLIGLCIRVKLLQTLPSRFKKIHTNYGKGCGEGQVEIRVAAGSHASEIAVNKQLNDKERVAAALENENLADVVSKCLESEE